jgi:arylsulfatase A-like enzyme
VLALCGLVAVAAGVSGAATTPRGGARCEQLEIRSASQAEAGRSGAIAIRAKACRRSALSVVGRLDRGGHPPKRITARKRVSVGPGTERIRLRLTRSGSRELRRCRGAALRLRGSFSAHGDRRKRGARTPLELDSSACTRPNVLLIITDDQRATGTLEVMENTRREFVDRGTQFTQAFATTPLCCPSRASIFSGLYPHNHGVLQNGGENFDADLTWQRYLDDAGYFTGLFGKYFVNVSAADAPHFDRRRATVYDDPDEPRLIAGYARDFLQEAEARDARPWALVLATSAPHAPWNGLPDVLEPIPAWQHTASFQEADLSDKHPAVATEAARFEPLGPDYPIEVRDGQLTELQLADETVGAVMGDLDRLDERRDTLAIFISDNGYQWGDHGLYHKLWPYLESVQIPLIVSWPGRVAEGIEDSRLVANLDLAPTILDAARVQTPLAFDGQSLFSAESRQWLFMEAPIDVSGRMPLWTAAYDGDRHYVEWEDGFVESYDLATDPAEISASNAADPALGGLLDAASSCSGASCP